MDKIDVNEVEINGEVYVKKSSTPSLALPVDGMPYIIHRSRAGIFAGYLSQKEGQEVVLVNSRQLWSWTGAATLSQLAVDGTNNPSGCKVPMAVPERTLPETMEMLTCTEKARKSIEGLPVWKR